MLKHVWKHVDHRSMSPAEKAALKKRLTEHKRKLQQAMAAVNQSLGALAGRGRKKKR
jgi:tetrahydromethanopterin S-methyltransferase subunit G